MTLVRFLLHSFLLIFLQVSEGAETQIPAHDVPDVHVPAGFTISIYATGVEGARSMALGDDGTVYVGTRDTGKVFAVRDKDGDGFAEDVRVIADGLVLPNGVALLNGDLYIADMTAIRRIPKSQLSSTVPVRPVTVFEGFPAKKHHGWKYLQAGPDGKLYLAVGVPCNICQPEAPYEGRLLRLDPNRPIPEVLAEGLRNSVGLTFGRDINDIWLTDNGRDWLGNDLPPDELNHWTGKPTHFGYPACHGRKVIDPEFGRTDACESSTPPVWEFPAHVAALAPHFYRGEQFPSAYKNQLLVVQHGSWNRTPPQGYRIVLMRMVEGQPVSEEVFAAGWLKADGKVVGRPVDIIEWPDGSLLVSDDLADVIYRISYTQGPKVHH